MELSTFGNRCVHTFGYDAFGNVRFSQGMGAGVAGGDFRFQGQWLESATGIYHFRARDYDARTGTFLSRDPVDSTAQNSEALNPYQFAYGNAYVYSDPSGMITLMELTQADNMGRILQSSQNYLRTQAYDYIKQKTGEAIGNAVWGALRSFLPGGEVAQDADRIIDVLDGNDREAKKGAGRDFESLLRGQMCKFLSPLENVLKNVWLRPTVAVSTGRVLDPGFHCPIEPEDKPWKGVGKGTTSFPDFIVSGENPSRPGVRSWLVGDVKASLRTLAYDYAEINGKGRNNPGQFEAITNHANNHGSRITGFIALQRGPVQMVGPYRAALQREGLRKQVVALVLTIIDR